jgi:hypothetical protein
MELFLKVKKFKLEDSINKVDFSKEIDFFSSSLMKEISIISKISSHKNLTKSFEFFFDFEVLQN